jgi:hypothetical protein
MIDYSREMSLVLSLTSLQNYLQKKLAIHYHCMELASQNTW